MPAQLNGIHLPTINGNRVTFSVKVLEDVAQAHHVILQDAPKILMKLRDMAVEGKGSDGKPDPWLQLAFMREYFKQIQGWTTATAEIANGINPLEVDATSLLKLLTKSELEKVKTKLHLLDFLKPDEVEELQRRATNTSEGPADASQERPPDSASSGRSDTAPKDSGSPSEPRP